MDLLGAPLLLLLIGGPAASGPPVVLDRIAAVVGDDPILESEVTKLSLVGLTSRRSDESDEAYRDRLLNERIVDLLREQKLRRTGGAEPDPVEVEARLAALRKRLADGRGLPLEERLRKACGSLDELRGWIRRGVALETYVNERVRPTIKVTDEEITAYCEGPFREEARAKGASELPPCEAIRDDLRGLLVERKLNREVERWTEQLRAETRVVIYRRAPLAGGAGVGCGGAGGGVAAGASSASPAKE